jgi:hypothetical protein
MSWLMRIPDGAGIPYFVDIAFTDNTTQASFTATLPSAWQAGDLFVLYTLGNNVAQTTVSSGWTLYGTFLTTGGGRVSVHYRIAQSGDTSPTVTFPSASITRVIAIASYRKSSGNPQIISHTFLTDFTSPYATGSITTTEPALIALGTAASASSGGASPISVGISGVDPDDVYSAANRAVAVTWYDGTTPGTFGPYTLTYSTTVSSAGARSILLEIR